MRRNYKLGFVVLALAAAACVCSPAGFFDRSNLDDPEESDGNAQADLPELRCETMGYPCNYGVSDADALERSNRLLDEAADMVGESGKTTGAAAFLESLDEVEEVIFDERAIFFRVKNSAPMIIFHPDFGPDHSTAISQRTSSAKPGHLSLVFSDEGPVGPQIAGTDIDKYALLISPFLWDFGDDEVSEIAAILSGHRDYQCPGCITVQTTPDNPLSNTTGQLQVGASIDSFLNWDLYDLIHVSTHGIQICGSKIDQGCVTMILTGNFRNETTMAPDTQNSLYKGVYHGRSSNTPAGWRFEVVTEDFFRSQYPAGLDDTLVFFSGCETMKANDLANALSGPDTAFLGWDESVDSGAAAEIATKFYEFLINKGLRAQVAFDKTKQFGGYAGGFGEAGADLLITGSNDLRGREVVALLHPIFRVKLDDDDTITTQGAAGDGSNDELFVVAQVDGIDEDQDPSEFIIHISINGQEVDKTFKPEVKVGDYSYRTKINVIPLSFDVVNQQTIDLEIWVELPKGGRTRQLLENVLPVGCGWNGKAGEEAISGNEVINSWDVANISPEELQQLVDLGLMKEEELEDLTPDNALANPQTFVLGSPSGFPLITASDQTGLLFLGQTLLYRSQNPGLNLVDNQGDLIYGKLNGAYSGIISQSTINYSGEFYWHVDSRCGMAVKLQAALNDMVEE